MTAEDLDIVITRDFAAPRELLFKCWTEAEHLQEWWGPKAFTAVCQTDLRAGGAYRFVMLGGGMEVPLSGTFLEIDPPAKVVQSMDVSENSDEWFDAVFPGRDRATGKPHIALTMTMTFEDLGSGRTRLTMRQRFGSKPHRDAFLKAGSEWGWGQSFDKLASLLVTLTAGEREIAVSRLIAAPREKVFDAFFDHKTISNWWGPNGFTTTTHSADPRVGGSWIYTMHGWGKDFPNRIIYREIERPSRIAYDHDGGEGGDPSHAFKSEITFTQERGGTRVLLRLVIATKEQRDGLAGFAVKGGQETLARLDAAVGTETGPA
jgi:uncharacterized protein YndB with AHSA1/START domain